MALYVKDPEVDALATRLAAERHISKTELVRIALRHEAERKGGDLVERTMEFVRELHKKAGPNRLPVDKAFIDSLYEDD